MNLKQNSNKNKLSKLEAVRGFAALYVVFHHLFSSELIIGGVNFSFLFHFGQEAVILFFVLSGFVISYSFEKSSDKSLKLFFFKRFFRIYIPLILVYITSYFLISYSSDNLLALDWKTLLGNIFMLQDASEIKPNVLFDPFLNNGPLWSLSYEWWFYFIFIFIYKNFNKNSSLIVYGLGILAAISYLFYPNFINRELMYLVIWWIGVDMAKLYLNKTDINFRTLFFPLIALLACTLILFFNIIIQEKTNIQKLQGIVGVHPWLEFRHFAFAFIIIIGALLWKKLKWFGFNITFGWFESIASISFGIYISHFFLIIHASYLDSIIENIFIRYCIYFTVCFVFSYLIEKVIYTKLNKFFINKIYKKQTN